MAALPQCPASGRRGKEENSNSQHAPGKGAWQNRSTNQRAGRTGRGLNAVSVVSAMNILPKKSWHVRNRDNVARVRRDEAAAEAERRKRDARALRAEQEARTQLLRKKARTGEGPSPPPPPPSPPLLFPPPQDTGGGNREHEEEKRQEQERRERALGVLTYLGQSAAEAQTCPPWYQRPPPARGRDVSGDVTAAPEEAAKRKAALDPLLDIRRGLRRHRNPPATQRPPPPPPRPNRGGSGPPSLEELRRQRLRREAEEAARSRALLEGLREKGGPPPQNQPPPDERARPYNSQFNPHLARGARGGPPREKPPKIG